MSSKELRQGARVEETASGPAGDGGSVGLASELRGFPRHPGDLVRLVLAAGILALSGVLAHRPHLSVAEVDLFRLVNDLPGVLYRPLWAVMQLGNLVAVPVIAVVALLFRRFRLAAKLAVTGFLVYFLAKAIKSVVDRARPHELLQSVHVRGGLATGAGFVSGHAAVSVALAAVAGPYLGRRARRVAWALVLVVCLSRVYVGAHLPLDVIGGAALGWGVGAIAHLTLGAGSGRPATARVRRALADSGLAPAELRPFGLDARRSACYATTTEQGERLFCKVVPQERRDTDLLYRLWRWVVRPLGTRSPRFGIPHHQVEHEALLALLAASAGVRTPPIRLATVFGNGAGILVEGWIDATSLDRLPRAQVAEPLLRDAWEQLGRLRRARIAHGDLAPASLLVDEDANVWLVDFDSGVAGADDRTLTHDVADLLVTLASVSDGASVVATGTPIIGHGALEEALTELRGRRARGGGRLIEELATALGR